MRTILFPFYDENMGGSYTSMATFAEGIIKHYKNKYRLVIVLSKKGRNYSLFEKTGAEIISLDLKDSTIKSLRNTGGGFIKRLIKLKSLSIYGFKLYMVQRRIKANIVHVNDVNSLWAFKWVKKSIPTKIIWEARQEKRGMRDSIFAPIADLLMSDAHCILGRFEGIPNCPPFKAVHNAVDLNRFKPPTSKIKAKEKIGLDKGSIYVGFVGNLVPRKRPEMSLKSVIKLIKQGFPLKMVVIGKDYSPNGEYSDKLKEIIQANGVANSIHLAGFQSNIPEWLQGIDIFIASSVRGGEAFPVSIVEAMASGLPIVSTNVAGIPEAVEDRANGFLSDPDDIEKLSINLQNLIENRGLIDEFSKESRRLAENRFNIKAKTEELIDIYDQLLDE
jgi:glycosyltransferase involved in cell wall biosynthesis